MKTALKCHLASLRMKTLLTEIRRKCTNMAAEGGSGSSKTTWYIPAPWEDSLQFFKEDKVEGAVYNVYLKKVRYHTPNDDVGILPSSTRSGQRSIFYFNIPGDDDEDDGKARLQWRVLELRVIKYGTLARLVEAIGLDNGELDSTYVNTLLSTYRSFASAKEVLDLLLDRYKELGEDSKTKQHLKAAHQKTIRTVIMLWMDSYPEDFREPPDYPCLRLVVKFAQLNIPDSDLASRAKFKIDTFTEQEESSGIISVDDICVDFHYDLLREIDFLSSGYLTRPVHFENIPCKVFAEQLTYVDAELFKKVLPHQCLGSVWSHRDKKRNEAPSVLATVNQFNAVACRVIATVLKHPDLPPAERAQVVQRWISIAQELRVLKNFSSMKAIISGLRSNPVYRLEKVWAEVDMEKTAIFEELSEIFSEENNQMMSRELLMMEGTAKFADPESYNTIRRQQKKKTNSWGTLKAKRTFTFDVPMVVQGTVPYLGTFLTDLTMIDTAIPSRTENGLINFEKKRKEFEVLAQIRLLQSAAQLYNIRPDQGFFEWFHSLRIYDDNESYELSCEIEPVSHSTPQQSRGHKKKSSLGYFSLRRPSVEEISLSSPSLASDESFGTTSSPDTELAVASAKLELRHSRSVGSLGSVNSNESSLTPLRSSESIVVKVILESTETHCSNLYKSIMLNNSDHTKSVIKNILGKFCIKSDPEHYVIFQILPDREFQLPDKGNVFYAINAKVPEVKFVVRKKSDLERLKERHLVGKARRKKFTL